MSSEMQTIAEEAILDYFRTHDAAPFHSDDLEHVIPDAHRGVIGLAVMALVNKKLIVGTGVYRKSAIPSRKRSPSQEYRLTELGRDRLVGVGSANREGTAAVHCGTLDRLEVSFRAESSSARSSDTADPGECSGEKLTGASPEPARLFDGPTPSAYDPYSEAA
jgi:hypothetical protein